MVNQFITQVTHQPTPLSIEREVSDVIVIEGVRYSGDFFRQMAYPSSDLLYVIRRDDDMVWLTTIRNVDEVQKFFEEIASASPRNDMTEVDDGI